jgi:hypothetical protein
MQILLREGNFFCLVKGWGSSDGRGETGKQDHVPSGSALRTSRPSVFFNTVAGKRLFFSRGIAPDMGAAGFSLSVPSVAGE